MATCIGNGFHFAVIIDVFAGVLFCAVFFSERDVLGEI